MSQIANTIQEVKNTRVKIGANNYELHIPSVKFARTAPKPVTWQGGTPEAQYAGSTPSVDHVAKIKLGHDYQNEDSAYNFFRAHEGETAVLEWKPDADGAYTETTTISIVSPDPGGDYGKQHDSEVSCPCTPPVVSFAAAAAPTIESLTPDTIGTAGGDNVLIKGTGFGSATVVEVDGVSVPFGYLGGGYIIVEDLPAHAAGDVDVTVENPTGTSAAETLTYA